MENHSVQFGSREIIFSVNHRKRKTLAITVYPDGSVVATAPIDATIEQIKAKVHRRAAWILKQLDISEQFQPKTTPRKYVSGETHYYLGRQYRLKIIESSKCEVIFRGGYIEIYAPDKSDKALIEKTLEAWYRAKAHEKFAILFKKCVAIIPLENDRKAQLTFKIVAMRKRWGSCTSSGNILLNPNLVKASKACIEYVILHELCHLVVPHHNADFYELQTRLMNDWRQHKRRLDLFV